nr:MAG TPA: hypothetical protein [Caudoviricetes sp.]
MNTGGGGVYIVPHARRVSPSSSRKNKKTPSHNGEY